METNANYFKLKQQRVVAVKDDENDSDADEESKDDATSEPVTDEMGPQEISKKKLNDLLKQLPPTQGSPSDWDIIQSRNLVDLDKMACMICKRQLDSLEKLEKHVRMSKLHMQQVNKTREKIFSELRYILNLLSLRLLL